MYGACAWEVMHNFQRLLMSLLEGNVRVRGSILYLVTVVPCVCVKRKHCLGLNIPCHCILISSKLPMEFGKKMASCSCQGSGYVPLLNGVTLVGVKGSPVFFVSGDVRMWAGF